MKDPEQALLSVLQAAVRGRQAAGLCAGFEGFVLANGRFYIPQSLPKPFRRGQPKVCFANSFRMLLRHGLRHRLTYVEGYALHDIGGPHPVLHAWCADSEGNVYDRTWGRPAEAYFGIAFKREYVIKATRERQKHTGEDEFGLLDNWQCGYPLLYELADRHDVWKA